MVSFIKSLGHLEIILFQCILWISIWLLDDYLGSLLTIILVPIFFFILVVSLIAELIERSKVPRHYFTILISAITVPLVIAIFVFYAYEGAFDWLKEL